ncbi:MAG: hypothetical protein ACK5ZQ_19255, partial [bacterium]
PRWRTFPSLITILEYKVAFPPKANAASPQATGKFLALPNTALNFAQGIKVVGKTTDACSSPGPSLRTKSTNRPRHRRRSNLAPDQFASFLE